MVTNAGRLVSVYPRVCGGTIERFDSPSDPMGLSPRVRGNPGECVYHAESEGSIPACAGEPQSIVTTESPTWVYPRVCGGTEIVAVGVAVVQGLSPRVRGNRRPRRAANQVKRSIPACAGEPTTLTIRTKLPSVYPRVCGGTTTCWGRTSTVIGLSPRVRGNRFARNIFWKRHGSIPACAGEPGWLH